MKNIIMTICAAVAMFTVVSCGESNPAIKAGEEFIDNPTRENFNTFKESIDNLSKEEEREYGIWYLENEKKIDEAADLVFESTLKRMEKAFDKAAESMGESMEESMEEAGESIEKAAESLEKIFK
jgi:tRNA nucleotidyltransferase (CCA-adding enzyme)